MSTERRNQNPTLFPARGLEVYATHVGKDMAVRIAIGDPISSGCFARYLSTAEARAYAAALIAAADFYDAETARLSGKSAPDGLPTDIAAPAELAEVSA